MKRLGSLLVAAVIAAGAPVALADEELEPCATLLGCGDDVAAMADYETKIDDHLWWGQLAEISYGSPARTPGDVVSGGAWGDSGLWTGTYMAAQAFRFATAEQYLAASPDDPFWAAQRAEALVRLEEMVDKYHLLVNIAEGWHEELGPELNPSPVSPVGFGGGVIDGERGMLMRACTPDDGTPGIRIEHGANKRVFGPFEWQDGKTYHCETAPSRDTYAGTTFGLLAAYDLVGDALGAGRKEQIRGDVLALAGFLVKYGWSYPRPHGNVSIPEVMDGHDFDNFISPLFVYVPLARLNMAQAARHVAQGTPEQARWDAVWAEELATQAPLLATSMEVDASDPHEGYYKFNLHHLTGYSLIRLEQDPGLRELFLQAIGVMDHTTGDDVNAHFETVTYALTGDTTKRDLAVQHLREWRDYRARIDAGGVTDNRIRCNVDIECVARDQRVIGGVIVPGTSTETRAARPLAVADRPPTDFLWQRPPVQLNGETSATHQAPGVDYLLPYWMLRYHTEVSVPAVTPFPAWPGPAHS
jgi:hypothetical protein